MSEQNRTTGRDIGVNILTYHSLSDGSEPTCIAPNIFREHMTILEGCGCPAVSLAEYAAWRRGEQKLAEGFFVLTFDDGLQDFATVAMAEIKRRGWSCTTFVPAGKVGGIYDWDPNATPRKLMDWPTLAELARAGIDIGAHGISHLDLSVISLEAARREIVDPKRMIEDRISSKVMSFAPPYGRSNDAVRDLIRQNYACSAGTTMAQATSDSNLFDLPRIDMYYFRNPARWRDYIEHGSMTYFTLRRMARAARQRMEQGLTMLSRRSKTPHTSGEELGS